VSGLRTSFPRAAALTRPITIIVALDGKTALGMYVCEYFGKASQKATGKEKAMIPSAKFQSSKATKPQSYKATKPQSHKATKANERKKEKTPAKNKAPIIQWFTEEKMKLQPRTTTTLFPSTYPV
jgi:hypothetical protein